MAFPAMRRQHAAQRRDIDEESGRDSVTSGEKRRRRIARILPCHLRLALLLGFLSFGTTIFQFRESLSWAWKNRYLYVGCPEKAVWLRKPSFAGKSDAPRIVHLTAKFGPGNGTYSLFVQNHVEQAARLGFLESSQIISYVDFPKDLVDDPTWKEHLHALYHGNSRGGGYWFWKPVLIHRHLLDLNDGDFLIFSDADMLDYFSWLPLLLESMLDWEANMAVNYQPYLEKDWTKRDVYEKFCPTRDIVSDNSGQYASGFLVLRRSEATLRFIADWIEAIKSFHDVSDAVSFTKNVPTFKEHRHDQSLLSLLLKCRYNEPFKRPFPWTCLQTWTLMTFRL